ncbi:MAG: Crp/Fnr family transcriptional regulator [Methylobacteriaceae bacterium]|nr:Crp/Fnr family transcriptional regulator [Methylobacteriaceae bacterium]
MTSRLSAIPLFQDTSLDLAKFEMRVRFRNVVKDEVIVDFDDPSSDVYVLLTGEVRVLIRTRLGKEVILGDLRAGSLFGELAAIDGIKRSANVTALTRGSICSISSAVFRELIFTERVVADRILRLLTRRVRELDARLMEHLVLDLRHRLYAELLRLSITRSGHEAQRVVTPPPYHHVLAARIGCRREQVTREFTTLESEALIERTRGALILKRPDILQARVTAALSDEA